MLENLGEGANIDLLYFDFSKAYDLVDLSILLLKLKDMGVGGNLLKWIKEFISERTLKVRVENSLSTSRNITSGVPQGSVLGPLLFLVYIEDLGKEQEQEPINIRTKILKYVDDTRLLRPIRILEISLKYRNI